MLRSGVSVHLFATERVIEDQAVVMLEVVEEPLGGVVTEPGELTRNRWMSGEESSFVGEVGDFRWGWS